MKIKILAFLFFLGCMQLWAEVGIISVTDEAKHSTKADFYHTFEYFIIPSGEETSTQVNKCQATRITRNWFVTAAHCVQETCRNGCELQLDLLETSPSVLARFTHTPQKPIVFIHPAYSPVIFAKNDFALLHLHVDRAPMLYYLRATPKQNYRRVISEKRFNAFVEKNRQAKSMLARVRSPKLPPILYFEEGNFALERTLSVIAIFDGAREVKQDPNPVYYLKALGFAHTKNFGIQKGMSGSGVMSNTGELVGMVAGNFETWYNPGNGAKKGVDYFMFPVFNKGLIDFMKDKMGSDFDKIDLKEANPYYVSKTHQDFSTLIQWVNRADRRLQQQTVPVKAPEKKK